MGEETPKRVYESILGKPKPIDELALYQQESIVSARIIHKASGNVTFFAFDEGQELSEHTAPFDALVTVFDGQVEIMVGPDWHRLGKGDAIILPANVPHAVKAVTRFKMLLTMIRA